MKCYFCKKHLNSISFTCKGCEFNFCARCRLPESHSCTKFEEFKQSKKDQLNEKLLSNASKESHHYDKL